MDPARLARRALLEFPHWVRRTPQAMLAFRRMRATREPFPHSPRALRVHRETGEANGAVPPAAPHISGRLASILRPVRGRDFVVAHHESPRTPNTQHLIHRSN